jgi:hypothetical protein
VSIFTAQEPGTITVPSATQDIGSGLEHLARSAAADPRLQALIERFGLVRDVIHDYGHGAVQVEILSEERTGTLVEGLRDGR